MTAVRTAPLFSPPSRSFEHLHDSSNFHDHLSFKLLPLSSLLFSRSFGSINSTNDHPPFGQRLCPVQAIRLFRYWFLAPSYGFQSCHFGLFLIRSEGFEHYCCDHKISLGMNLNIMAKMLRCAGNDYIVMLKADDSSDCITLMFENPFVVGRGRDIAATKYSDWIRCRRSLEKLRSPSVTELLLLNDDQILEGCLTNMLSVVWCLQDNNEDEEKSVLDSANFRVMR